MIVNSKYDILNKNLFFEFIFDCLCFFISKFASHYLYEKCRKANFLSVVSKRQK